MPQSEGSENSLKLANVTKLGLLMQLKITFCDIKPDGFCVVDLLNKVLSLCLSVNIPCLTNINNNELAGFTALNAYSVPHATFVALKITQLIWTIDCLSYFEKLWLWTHEM